MVNTKHIHVCMCIYNIIMCKMFIPFQGMFFVARDRGPRLFPREPRSPSLWGHCSSNLPPPTKTAQSQLETKAPLAEGRWDDETAPSA